MLKNITKKNKKLLLVLVAVLAIGVGGTIAFIIAQTGNVSNIFNPAKVECEVGEIFENNVKRDVHVKNTGNIPAYIRADIVVNWRNAEGEIYGQTPVEGIDYSISLTANKEGSKWFSKGDYYYYKDIVSNESPKNNTEILISTCSLLSTATPPDEYYLSVEILAEAVQADGGSKIGEPAVWTPAVTQAWGVNVVDGKLSVE